MSHQLYRVVAFQIVGDYTIWVRFDDESERVIKFEPVLYGEVFGPLRDLSRFNQVKLDLEAHTLVWPGGGDFDPETLRNWDEREMAELGQQWEAHAELALA